MGLFKTIKKKKKNIHRVVSKTVQESIPYTMLYKTRGTIETRPGYFTRAFILEDINFKFASKEEQIDIFKAYGDFLNSFSSNVHFQILIQKSPADRKALFENIRFRPQKGNLNKYRQEKNKMFLDKITDGNRSLKQDKYLVVSIEESDVACAMTRLNGIEKEIETNIKNISADASIKLLTTTERLEQLFNI